MGSRGFRYECPKYPPSVSPLGLVASYLICADVRFHITMTHRNDRYYTWHKHHHLSRILYKNIHAVHHEYYAPFVFVTQYAHPCELIAVVSNNSTNPHTPVSLASTLDGGSHRSLSESAYPALPPHTLTCAHLCRPPSS